MLYEEEFTEVNFLAKCCEDLTFCFTSLGEVHIMISHHQSSLMLSPLLLSRHFAKSYLPPSLFILTCPCLFFLFGEGLLFYRLEE